ncbi:MAG: L-2-hydroxyglutarate oxidase [Bauldia sp.]|nr:L-2-hydroxyglutarate oxidase [Bauldia sp.]
MRFDYCVIGGGIVGLATARAILERWPGASLLLLEKEDRLAAHQTGHNSGVIHAGIYYPPGSLKASLCREGNRATKEFCDEVGIPYETCGKLVVATNALERSRLDDLTERAGVNGIEVRPLSAEAMREIEPEIVGEGALLVQSTGIVDYGRVSAAMADMLARAGADIRLGAKVTGIRESLSKVEVDTAGESFEANHLIVCGGLQSDRLARLAGFDVDFRIVPFRGEYFEVSSSHADRIRHLIYPVPIPGLPFLGIHLTRMIDGKVTAGPNAVLGRGRECYDKLSVDAADVADYMTFSGFWRMAAANLKPGVAELGRSFSKSLFLRECQKYAPGIGMAELKPYPAGIRAQAVMRDGSLQGDFLFLESDRMLHVCNTPSPAATSALPIGRAVTEKVATRGGVRRYLSPG